MLPEWLLIKDNYKPVKDHHQYIYKTLNSVSDVMRRIALQKGHEKKTFMPSLFKLILTVFLILMISVTQTKLLLLMITTFTLVYLCLWPAEDLLHFMKSAVIIGFITLIILLPAMILNHEIIYNDLILTGKVMLSITILNIFNHTTSWNHITRDLKKLHVPGIFIFILDISLKFIILLGNTISDMLTALKLRSVGKTNNKYQSVGGIMGSTFIKGIEMNNDMYNAMVCRCFTNDYKGL